jgi:esterase/lipase
MIVTIVSYFTDYRRFTLCCTFRQMWSQYFYGAHMCSMTVIRQSIHSNGFKVPGILLVPTNARSAVVIAHGYGGCKEEPLGLAWRVAESGLAVCSIDIRGHGEHALPMDEHIQDDMEAAIEYCRRYGKVTAIGHSLGGRLALLSSADHMIGISPALNRIFSPQTREVLKNLRSYRVREMYPGQNFDILNQLPIYRHEAGREAMIVYGSRDVPEITAACNEIASSVPTVLIENAMHNDIYTLEATFKCVIKQLSAWS